MNENGRKFTKLCSNHLCEEACAFYQYSQRAANSDRNPEEIKKSIAKQLQIVTDVFECPNTADVLAKLPDNIRPVEPAVKNDPYIENKRPWSDAWSGI